MAEKLNCEKRDFTGTLRNRRLRNSGRTPAILYGRGDSVSLSLLTKDIASAIRHGSRIVELEGDCNESALIKDVQWDSFGVDVLHVDMTRIDVSESVDLTLQVELVGAAPGSKTGGMVKHLLHRIDVSCPASAVPEKLFVRINDLELNDDIKVSEIPLPEGAVLITDSEEIVVQCVEASTLEDESIESDSDAQMEPEVIGRKSDDEDEGDA